MEIEKYINQEKLRYQLLLGFFESEDDTDANELIHNCKDLELLDNKEDLKSFLHLITKIFNNHHRSLDFLTKTKQIIKESFPQIKQTFSNFETFKIFKSNKYLLQFLIKNQILVIDEDVSSFILQNRYLKYSKYQTCFHFFFPEISQFIDSKRKAKYENEIISIDPNAFINFEQKREIGENDSYISSLIRNDSIEEFVYYVNKNSISLLTKIQPSIFETNTFLIYKQPTLIEYAAFFGSIQIFQYLRLNKVKLTSSLWLYVIHSQNAELIHLLEEDHILPDDTSYFECLEESIKCHHNDFAKYFIDNIITKKSDEKIIEYCFHYNNLSFIPSKPNPIIFSNACKFNHLDLVKLLIKSNEKLFDNEICDELRIAVEKKNDKLVNALLSKPRMKINKDCFRDCLELTQISIPSNVISIGEYSFCGCHSLTQITIPSSVTFIGRNSFNGCKSLTKISLSHSIISIEPFTFCDCESLKEISIPSSVVSIKVSAFCNCKSIVEISIPSSVKEIGECAFGGCLSLKEILIPNSVVSIGEYAFSRCSSLTKISIPSSVTKIGILIFTGCSSLTQVKIPSKLNTNKLGISSDFVYEI